MTPLERAARAYHDSTRRYRMIRDCEFPGRPPVAKPMPFVEWEKLNPEAKEARANQVRAVLEALKNPSEEMLERGRFEAESCTDDWTSAAACLPGHVWKGMIKAALGDAG